MIFSPSDIICVIKKGYLFVIGILTPAVSTSVTNYGDSPAVPFSNNIWNIVLVKNTEQHFALPNNANWLLISSNTISGGSGTNSTGGGNYYLKLGNSLVRAAIPTQNIIDGYGSYINSYGIHIDINQANTISLIADQDTILQLAFFS